MNALTKSATGGAVANFANPFAAAGAGAGNATYMKFKGASGDFLFGQDDEEMKHGSTFGADIENSKWVWSFWWEGDVLETIETRVDQNPLAFENEPDFLPDDYTGDMSLEEIRAEQADRKSTFMDGWSCQAVLGMRAVGGEAEEFVLKLNQGVALNAFRTMLSSYGRVFRMKTGLVPVIELSARSYVSKNKTVGKRYTPVLKITEWLSEDELMTAVGDDPEMYDEPERDEAPAKGTTKTIAAPVEDKAPETDAPRGRRGARGAANYG